MDLRSYELRWHFLIGILVDVMQMDIVTACQEITSSLMCFRIKSATYSWSLVGTNSFLLLYTKNIMIKRIEIMFSVIGMQIN